MKQPRIYVIGAIAGVDSHERIEYLAQVLAQYGFTEVFHPKQRPIDHARDWREAEKEELLKLFHDLSAFIRDGTDVLIAELHDASDGRMLEMVLAKLHGKPVIGFAPEPINSPWRFVYLTRLTRTHEELIAALENPGTQNPIFYR